MLLPGLVSITFRKLSPHQIVEQAAKSGLRGIEWGGDVHVPHGDLEKARLVRRITKDAGLEVAAYGSYYRVGESEGTLDGEELAFANVLATAVELGAPTIRVWAGRKGSNAADDAYRAIVADDSRRISEMAAAAGITISYEFHGGTLTDTGESAKALLQQVSCGTMRCYWQPAVGLSDADRLASLRAVLPHLSNVHVFHWQDGERLPLAQGSALWISAFRAARTQISAGTHFALLEFVTGDAPELLAREAETLRELLGKADAPVLEFP